MRNKFNTLANREPAAVLVSLTYILTVFVLALLNSCTTARPPATSSIQRHEYSHDARTRHAEPYTIHRSR